MQSRRQRGMDPARLVFLDESRAKTNMTRRCGRRSEDRCGQADHRPCRRGTAVAQQLTGHADAEQHANYVNADLDVLRGAVQSIKLTA